jgi:hypothetical protein
LTKKVVWLDFGYFFTNSSGRPGREFYSDDVVITCLRRKMFDSCRIGYLMMLVNAPGLQDFSWHNIPKRE